MVLENTRPGAGPAVLVPRLDVPHPCHPYTATNCVYEVKVTSQDEDGNDTVALYIGASQDLSLPFLTDLFGCSRMSEVREIRSLHPNWKQQSLLVGTPGHCHCLLAAIWKEKRFHEFFTTDIVYHIAHIKLILMVDGDIYFQIVAYWWQFYILLWFMFKACH